MTIENIIEEAKNAKEEAQQIILEAKEKVKSLLAKGMKALFEAYPDIETFSWTQYTPYFMDGDPCEFSVNTYSIDVNDVGVSFYGDPCEFTEPAKHVQSLLNAIGDDALELLGEGKVVFNRDLTVVVEDYDHD